MGQSPTPPSPSLARGRAAEAAGTEAAKADSNRARPSSAPSQPTFLRPSGLEEESSSPISLADRRKQLEVLAAEVKPCTRCPELAATRTQTVFGDGQPGAELCFIGEAPGADEDAQGLPFVGAAGQLLNKIIAACGLKREEVYICNILKCRPPGNRTPLPNEADNCRGFLEGSSISSSQSTSFAWRLDRGQVPSQSHDIARRAAQVFHEYNGIPVIVTYHPAYLLPHRNPAMKKEVWEDMKMLLTKMGRPIPAKKDDEPGSEQQ